MRGTVATVSGLVGLVVLLSAAAAAHADEWYFRWECAGACAPDRLTVSGVDGPYAGEGDCGQAQRRRRTEINGPGSAGSASSCYTSDRSGAGGGGGLAPVRPARVARMYVSALYGAPWHVEYADGRALDTGATSGGTLTLAVGHQVFGFLFGLGATRAAASAAVGDPIWFYDLQVGLHSSPMAFLVRPGLELRPDLAVAGIDVGRLGCDQPCDHDITNIAYKPEPEHAFGVRASAGLDLWLGRRRKTGVAVEGVVQALRMGGNTALDDPDAEFGARLTAPVWTVRVSWIVRGADFAAY